MLQLKSFLREAKVSEKNFEKTADIFKRFIEKILGTTLYRYGGNRNKLVQTKTGVGILYFYDSSKALRINYSAGEIKSITLWNKFKLGAKGDYTIDLDGINLLAAGKKVAEILRNPKVSVVPTIEDLQENFLAEATRVTPEDFVNMAVKQFNGNIRALTWGEVCEVGIVNDVQIPGPIKDTKIGKGNNAKFDLTKALKAPTASTVAKTNDPIYYIKVTAQDPETNKFISVKDDSVAKGYLDTIGKALKNPPPKEEVKDPDSMFNIMYSLTKLVARKKRNALIIYGGPGIGKTFGVIETLNGEGAVKNKDWFVIKGKITTAALYQTLFIHRKDSILVFDDTDSVWGDAEAANVLKAALDSYSERTVSWLSARTINVSKMTQEDRDQMNYNLDQTMLNEPDKPIKLPSEFVYTGRIIFISNLPYEKFDSAVLTRCAKIDMTLTMKQIFIRMKSLVAKGVLGSKDVPLSVKYEILEFLENEAVDTLDSVSLRTFVSAEDLYLSGLPEWKTLLAYV